MRVLFSKSSAWAGLGITAAGIAILLMRWSLLLTGDRVFFLQDGASSRWILRDSPFELRAKGQLATKTLFRHEFSLRGPVEGARLRLQAFRRFSLWLDQDFQSDSPLFVSPADMSGWRSQHDVALPSVIPAGRHVLHVFVENAGAPSCLKADSVALGIGTDASWQAYRADGAWDPVRFATDPPVVGLADRYPTVLASFAALLPWITTIFGLFATAAMFSTMHGVHYAPRANHVRVALLVAYAVLCLNNIFAIRSVHGFDIVGHMEYVSYVARHGRLPLPTEGWTMFQSPLFYLVAAPFHALCSAVSGPETSVKLLRFIPMLCGGAIIDICYRSAQVVFPDDEESQAIATVIGGFLPMNIYHSQLVHNEPLAACLTAVALTLCLPLLAEPFRARSLRWFASIGGAWGLALLSKATPVILAPVLLGAVVRRGRIRGGAWRRTILEAGTLVGAAVTVAGWYYLRNWIYLGRPFIGGWDRQRGIDWWQDPGYRTSSQFATFGRSLTQPVYAGCWSVWDGLYSTMLTDGWLSGSIFEPPEYPGNVHWMESLAFLGLLPGACILVGGFFSIGPSVIRNRDCLMFSFVSVALLLAAIVDLWIQLPIYATCKATFMLGAAPCLGLLGVTGARPLLTRAWTRPFLIGWLGAWASAVWITFFCVKPLP